ncbi:MAG: hypothetical protein NTW25_10605 [Candidatus Kapabacteria bacterium]|nr:hypothetical protein [Candidatus Kapabacteria bacterium]
MKKNKLLKLLILITIVVFILFQTLFRETKGKYVKTINLNKVLFIEVYEPLSFTCGDSYQSTFLTDSISFNEFLTMLNDNEQFDSTYISMCDTNLLILKKFCIVPDFKNKKDNRNTLYKEYTEIIGFDLRWVLKFKCMIFKDLCLYLYS